MQISKLRLIGFKSFVEPTELLIEQGLTGVVGPNGCGKSNLLEALRWSMGETSYKSMRGASMEDVIFNGTTQRPARNMAEVTMFIDNSARRAPAEFNDHDVLEVTRRIERDMGSAYRVNGREARARDIKILFEDAATGARSPALVRQGQIAEIVNAKPEQRRRILEDAAGVAGLHSRRHEAELRLRGAEANLARVQDVLGQLGSQIESLKRQARQANRYKELSEEIRRSEALLYHALWLHLESEIAADEHQLAQDLAAVALATQREAALVVEEHASAIQLPALRQAEAERAAALQRIVMTQENFEREAARAAQRQQDLEQRAAQLKRDQQREAQLLAEAQQTMARLQSEAQALQQTNSQTETLEHQAAAALATAEAAVKHVEQRLAGLQTAAAETRARRKSLEAQRIERNDGVAQLQRQLSSLDLQLAEITANAPDAHALQTLADASQTLQLQLQDLEAASESAEEQLLLAADDALRTRDASSVATLDASRLSTEVETLLKVLPSATAGSALVVDQIVVAAGYELALGAALGDDLDVALDRDAAVHWRLNVAVGRDPKLPKGATPLLEHVTAPPALARRLAQIGVVAVADGARLQRQLFAGQRLVSLDGDLWRWDGYVAGVHGATAAGIRHTERTRLGALKTAQAAAVAHADIATRDATRTAAALLTIEARARHLRAETRELQTQRATTRETTVALERKARETEQRLALATEARTSLQVALRDASAKRDDITLALEHLGDADPFEEMLDGALDAAAEKRLAVAEARADLATLDRDHRARAQRMSVVTADIDRWQLRHDHAAEHSAALEDRIAATADALLTADARPDTLEDQRQTLLTTRADAERNRQAAADALIAAETQLRETQALLRTAQASVSALREGKARREATLDSVRARRADHVRKTQEAVGVLPAGCLAIAGLTSDANLPAHDELERALNRAKSDRDRLGGVNLAAAEDLAKIADQFDGLDRERQDVEDAIAALRGGIAALNKDAKGRLDTAFATVNGHFQHLFGVLFNGGEARLEMIQSAEDPLQGGLEIIAKPPGKKPAVLSLLSGGEQTLTALSLIFAVFLTNPSPICVLDEVDAPLDDANVDRFCTMMERMAADTATRFLVITHHPVTMARMNRLFGVTMAEKGVSQLVSVDLEAARGFVEAA